MRRCPLCPVRGVEKRCPAQGLARRPLTARSSGTCTGPAGSAARVAAVCRARSTSPLHPAWSRRDEPPTRPSLPTSCRCHGPGRSGHVLPRTARDCPGSQATARTATRGTGRGARHVHQAGVARARHPRRHAQLACRPAATRPADHPRCPSRAAAAAAPAGASSTRQRQRRQRPAWPPAAVRHEHRVPPRRATSPPRSCSAAVLASARARSASDGATWLRSM